MVGGGVETACGRDQFPSLTHAQQHFASCILVVAGGLEDVRDAVGGVALLQEAEDGLPIRGADGTGAQARELAVVTFAQPVDGGDACFRDEDVIGQDGRLRAEGMLRRDQELAAVILWVGSEKQATASGLEQGRSGAG